MVKKKNTAHKPSGADRRPEAAAGKPDQADPKESFRQRLQGHHDELKWLYCELYGGETPYFSKLMEQLPKWQAMRDASLTQLDLAREKDPQWYKKNDLLGMMMYVDAFAGNLEGVRSKLDYIEECQVNYLHLMPILSSPKGRSDGGYAVSDFRTVQPDLGTMEDLKALSEDCHRRGISVCLDFVMNHTSEDHEWARRARGGDPEYMDRYFFYDTYDIPAQYESTVPQVFPTTAPGNFTWLPDMGRFVMTTFYPYQWDLNYRNPAVLNEMVDNMLNLANQGVDIIRIDAVPYIWKELGTSCRNLPQVHTIVRMMRMICEIVCPGVLLLGEVVMEPEKVVPYFGTLDKPECHMLYNVTTMASTWHTVATRDTRLLRRQMDIVSRLPKDYVFLNYLRCHDDIGWGLDYAWLQQFGTQEVPHKRYLNEFLTGRHPGSFARGELYNDDPSSGDARLCGTTASLCGVEKAYWEKDGEGTRMAVRRILMLHAYLFAQSGIPVLYSGDEIGQTNDYSYKKDQEKAVDSRYVHRGAFQWELAKLRKADGSMQKEIFDGLREMESIRASHPVFEAAASMWTLDTGDDSILGIARQNGEEKLLALFNFSDQDKTCRIREDGGRYRDLLTGDLMYAKDVAVPAWGCLWLLQTVDKLGFAHREIEGGAPRTGII